MSATDRFKRLTENLQVLLLMVRKGNIFSYKSFPNLHTLLRPLASRMKQKVSSKSISNSEQSTHPQRFNFASPWPPKDTASGSALRNLLGIPSNEDMGQGLGLTASMQLGPLSFSCQPKRASFRDGPVDPPAE